MHRILDKLALIFLSSVALFCLDGLAEPVLLLLFSVICSELTYLLPDKFKLLPAAAYCISALFLPPAAIMLPLFVYDISWLKRYPLLILCIAGFALAVPSFSALQISCILISAFVAVLLQYRTSNAEALRKRLTEQRDESEEIRLLLSERNKNLLEKQDSEIYMATLKERNRIAREIHDNVGHALTRCLLQVGALQIVNKDEALSESIDSIKETLSGAMTSIRSSVHDLHNTTIDLKRLIGECTAPLSDSFTVKLDYDISDSTHVNIKLCLLGIIKEALSNVVKHSSGDTVSISVREHPAFYQLIVSDNGKNTGEIKNTGMGLAGMRERAENSGGIFTVTTSENEFRIFVSIPKSR